MKRLTMFFILFLFIIYSSCLAHKISAFVDVEGNKVTVFSYFSDGTPVKNGKIEVYEEKTNKLILSGETNKEGKFTFTLPKRIDYKIIVIAELGHVAVAHIKASELPEEAFPKKIKEPKKKLKIVKTYKKKEEINKTKKLEYFAEINEEKIKKIVREVIKEELKKEFKPIHAKLLNIEMKLSKVSFKDVFSGIGWILGIFGAWALAYSRKRNGK